MAFNDSGGMTPIRGQVPLIRLAPVWRNAAWFSVRTSFSDRELFWYIRLAKTGLMYQFCYCFVLVC